MSSELFNIDRSIGELDELRANIMRALLNETGRGQIWKYDVCQTRYALLDAIERQNFDDIVTDAEAAKAGKRFVLLGAGIEDHPFDTVDELLSILYWLCCEGYLSCYSYEKLPEAQRAQN